MPKKRRTQILDFHVTNSNGGGVSFKSAPEFVVNDESAIASAALMLIGAGVKLPVTIPEDAARKFFGRRG